MRALARRGYELLIAPRASDEDDAQRELALNWVLIASLMLAALPAVQRAVQISQGGSDTADHVQTLIVLISAGSGLAFLLFLSRRGRAVVAGRGLLAVYYGLLIWSTLTEGPQKSTTILICAVFVVTAGVVCGRFAAAVTAGLAAATLGVVTVLDRANVIAGPTEKISPVPDPVTLVLMMGTFGAIALLLGTRTRERSRSVAELIGGPSPTSLLTELRTGALSVRELQVARLIAAGRSNDDISRELIVSPRTVHSHVSSALHKTGCANRTELAVLMVREGLAAPEDAPARAESLVDGH